MLSGILYLMISWATATSTFYSSDQCCFVHPSFSGVCLVEPAPGETCASILSYLNSAGTVGKTYCGNTTIRGGWKQINCQ